MIVQDGLLVIKKSINTIRDSCAFWSATQSKVEKFKALAHEMGIPYTKSLFLDCKTRWNSTYLMLEAAILYKDVFPSLTLREPKYTNVSSENDWVTTKLICEKLSIFYRATEIFSGIKYPTSNLYFIETCEIRQAICSSMESEDLLIYNMAKHMFDKFSKYWNEVNLPLAVSIVLDPSYKLKVVVFYFSTIYGDRVGFQIAKIKKTCYELFREYQYCQSRTCSSVVSSSSSVDSSIVENTISISSKSGLLQFLNDNSSNVHVKSELDHYLEEGVLPWSENSDIILLWKTNGIMYPTLQTMARDFLAILVSTVASEATFSTSGRVVDSYRSRLQVNTLEALMCSQDWLRKAIDDHESQQPLSICNPETDEKVDIVTQA